MKFIFCIYLITFFFTSSVTANQNLSEKYKLDQKSFRQLSKKQQEFMLGVLYSFEKIKFKEAGCIDYRKEFLKNTINIYFSKVPHPDNLIGNSNFKKEFWIFPRFFNTRHSETGGQYQPFEKLKLLIHEMSHSIEGMPPHVICKSGYNKGKRRCDTKFKIDGTGGAHNYENAFLRCLLKAKGHKFNTKMIEYYVKHLAISNYTDLRDTGNLLHEVGL